MFMKKKKEETVTPKAEPVKKEKKYTVKTIGNFTIDVASMQSRFRDISWFNALAFQADRNDLMSVVYLDAEGKELPVAAIRVDFKQSVDMQKMLEKR